MLKLRWLLCAVVLSVSCTALGQSAGSSFPPAPSLNHFDPGVVDRALDPCNDFYKFTCSKWLTANPIPPDQAVWGTGSNLQLWNETMLRETMIQASNPSASRDATQQTIGDYWAACMDESGIESKGLKAIQPELDRIKAIKSKADLPEAIARVHQGVPAAWSGDDNQTAVAAFGVGPQQDFKDASLVVTGIDQGGMGMPGRDFYLSDNPRLQDTRKKYLEHVRKMFMLAGDSEAQAAAAAATVMKMETAFARAAMDPVKRRDPANIYNVMTLNQVQATTPSFDWNRYLKTVGAPIPKHYIVTEPGFFRALEQAIQTEPLENWKTYLYWWTLHGNAPYLSKAFVEENFDFYGRTLTGAQKQRPRWRRCVAFADRDLGEALGKEYVAKAFPPQSKERVDEMVRSIEQALGRDIDTLNWMSPETKKQAHIKLAAIENKIGYPKVWRDYSSVTIARDSFPANVHQATAFEFRRQLDKIGKPVDRGEWGMTPPTINAYYDPQLNTINFPAGILQPPYFDPKADDAANYGAIGVVIGHEITHGFDDQGRKFDARGDMRDWWTPEDAKKYDERGKCIADEYTGEIPGLGVKQNGLLTQGEDTADNGGIRIALMALAEKYQQAGKSIDDAGSNGWTPRQRFFLAHAYSWCDAWRPEVARTIVVTNPHSMPELRVDNVESNMPEFSQAFGCKQGMKMVRANACRVW
ncbi:MAG TPA: M13 family metallopeptidase [Terriglobales bacterium]|nr:M13 family metallopeptidase [Terriglobales bacterium]